MVISFTNLHIFYSNFVQLVAYFAKILSCFSSTDDFTYPPAPGTGVGPGTAQHTSQPLFHPLLPPASPSRLCKVYPGCTEKEPKARVPRLVIKPQRSVQTGLSL